MKKIHFSRHASIRLNEPRQKGIVRQDVIRACHKAKDELKYMCLDDTVKLDNIIARSGRKFSTVVSKRDYGLKIVTIIGEEWGKPTYAKRRSKEKSLREYRQGTRKTRW